MGFPSGTVTLLFTDAGDGIGLWEADCDVMAEVSARHNRLVREQIVAAGGQLADGGGLCDLGEYRMKDLGRAERDAK